MLFFLHEQNIQWGISLRSEQFRGQNVLGPLEKSQEMPHYMFCPGQKKLHLGLSKSELHWYFYVPNREREKERERESERKRAIKGKGKEREREREKKSVGNYIYKPPGPVKNPGTIQYCRGKSGIQ
jgi:hypothetical protein